MIENIKDSWQIGRDLVQLISVWIAGGFTIMTTWSVTDWLGAIQSVVSILVGIGTIIFTVLKIIDMLKRWRKA